jgi:NADH:ubiquinone oxidoreductase subunit E
VPTREIEEQIGIKEGETSKDREYSIETVSCIGACGLAPTMVVNETTYGRLTRKEVSKLLESFRGPAKEGQNGR